MKKLKILSLIAISSLVIYLAVLNFSVKAAWPGFATGQDTIASKGTPEQMSSLEIPKDLRIVIKAKTANTGIVYIGDSAATALYSGTSHFKLYPGESIELNISNANLVWLDAETGEGIEYIVESDN